MPDNFPDMILTGRGPIGRDQAIAQLRLLERQRLEAMRSNDAAALEDLLAPEMVCLCQSGALCRRNEYIQAIESRALIYSDDVELDEEEIVVSPQVLIALGVMGGHALLHGKQQAFNLRYAATWMRINGRWRLAVMQKTPMVQDAHSHAPATPAQDGPSRPQSESEEALDEALMESFPASDPPSMTDPDHRIRSLDLLERGERQA